MRLRAKDFPKPAERNEQAQGRQKNKGRVIRSALCTAALLGTFVAVNYFSSEREIALPREIRDWQVESVSGRCGENDLGLIQKVREKAASEAEKGNKDRADQFRAFELVVRRHLELKKDECSR